MAKRRGFLSTLFQTLEADPTTRRGSELPPKLASQEQNNLAVKKPPRGRPRIITPDVDYIGLLKGEAPSEGEFSERVKRNLAILRERAAGSTLDEIGQNYGLTREAVRQIIVKCGGSGFTLHTQAVRESQLSEVESKNEALRSFVRSHPGITIVELASEFGLKKDVALSRLTKSEKKLISGSKLVRDKSRIWSDEMILDALRLAQTYHYPLTTTDYQELVTIGEIKGPSVPLIANRYKTWSQACIAAGVEYVEAYTTYSVTWSREDLVEIVGEYLLDPETTGTVGDYNRWRDAATDRIPSFAQLRIVVGPWSQACDEALSNIRSNRWDTSNDI